MTFEEIVKEITQEFPKFKIVVKDTSKFMWALYYGLLMFWWCPTYMTNFTTVVGTTVYMPKDLIGTDRAADVLRHERVHMRDFAKWTVLYLISYVMLPIGPSGRAYWELRGYKETMQAYFDRYHKIDDNIIEFIADQFTGPKYLYMMPFPKFIHKTLNGYRNEITG